MSDMKPYHNNLTMDKNNAKQKRRMVKYPTVGTGNAAEHDCQTYVIMGDGTLYGHLDYQLNKNKLAFLTGALEMTELNPKAWYSFCMTMEKSGTIN